MLVVARVVQAVGGCGGLVLGRAIVRDSAVSGEAVSRMALLTMVQSLAPGVGPAVGGLLGAWFGWRSIFVLLVGLGIVTRGGVWLALPETAASRQAARSGRMLGSYLRLLHSPVFCGYMFGGAFTSTSFYAYLTASPFIHPDAAPARRGDRALLPRGDGGRTHGQFRVEPARSPGSLNLAAAHDERDLSARRGALFYGFCDRNAQRRVGAGYHIILSIGVGASAPIAITSAISTDPQTIGAAAGLCGFVQMANGVA
jgi:DHA1 family bicyclomycin/chloramphenicol resistance-like MFS transporter